MVPKAEAAEEDFRFWFDNLTPEERVMEVEACTLSALKAQGIDEMPRFREFLASCNDRGVRYLVVGAHAVALHAQPRATKDLDETEAQVVVGNSSIFAR